MSITLQRRPGASAWVELAEADMDKRAALGWVAPAARAVWNAALKPAGKAVYREALKPIYNEALKPVGQKIYGAAAPAVRATGRKADELFGRALYGAQPSWGQFGKSTAILGGGAAAGGATGALGSYMLGPERNEALGNAVTLGHLAANARESTRLGDAAEAQAKALQAARAKAEGPQPLEGIGQAVAPARQWAVDHWPILAAGGLALGGGGMWLKARADRKRKEEEEELLAGLHPKQAMVKLAAEFPVQVGFLARCGERKLSGREVRRAVEKCAAISDGLADDWIRFFVKAAAVGSPIGIPETPLEAPKVEAPKPAAPVVPQPPRPGVGTVLRAETPVQPAPAAQPQAPAKPYLTNTQQILAQHPETMTNTQRAMANAPSSRDIAVRGQWQRQIDEASRRGDLTGMRRLQANPPQAGPAVGPSGADRPMLSPAQQLARKNVVEGRQQEMEEAANQAQEEHLFKQRITPTTADVAAGQKATADAVNAGVKPPTDWTSPAEDPTVGSYAGNAGAAMGNVVPGLYGTTMGLASDIGHGRFNPADFGTDQFLPGAASGARDFTSPLSTGLGAASGTSPKGGRSFTHDTVPEFANRMRDISEADQGPMFPGTNVPIPGGQTAAGLAQRGAENYPLLANLTTLGSIPGAGAVAKGLGLNTLRGAALTGGLEAATYGIPEWQEHNITDETGKTPAQQARVAREEEEMRVGKRPWSPEMATTAPEGANKQEWEQYVRSTVQQQYQNANIERAQAGQPPMNEQESQAFKEKALAPIQAAYTGRQQDAVAKTIPGMADPATGKYNPKGQIDLGPNSGYNPKDVRGYMTPERTEAMQHMQAMDNKTLGEMARKLPPEVQQRIANKETLTPQDMEALRANGYDPDTILATAQRSATSGAMLTAQRDYNGNMHAAHEMMQTPEAMRKAAMNDPALAAKAQETAQADGTDWMTGLSKMWNGLGGLGQILVGGGLALGAFGLINSLMGEGGMGSILMTLLGGGAVALGANKANLLGEGVGNFLNPILKGFGLDALAGGKPGAVGATTPAAQTAAAAQAGAPQANPPVGGAAAQVGVGMPDAAARQKLMGLPPAQQQVEFQQAMAKNPAMKDQLSNASMLWNLPFGTGQNMVLSQAQQSMPGITMPEVTRMMELYAQNQGAAPR